MRTRTFTEEIQRWRESGMKTRLCFEGCRGDTKELEDLKFPADYTDFSGMFKNCKDINVLDLSSWDVSKAKNLSYMFYGCENLSGLYIEGWDISNAEDTSCMFGKCSKMEMLELSDTVFPKKDTEWNLFRGCTDFACICMHGADENAINSVLDSIYEARLQDKAFIQCNSNFKEKYETVTSYIDQAYILDRKIEEENISYRELYNCLMEYIKLFSILKQQTLFRGYKKKVLCNVESKVLDKILADLKDKDPLHIPLSEATYYKVDIPYLDGILDQINESDADNTSRIQQLRQKLNEYEVEFNKRCRTLYNENIERFDTPVCSPVIIPENWDCLVKGDQFVECCYTADGHSRLRIRNCYINLWGFDNPYPILALAVDVPIDGFKRARLWGIEPYTNSELQKRYKGWHFFKPTNDRSVANHWLICFENIPRDAKTVELAHLTDDGVLHRIYYANFQYQHKGK